MMFKTAALILVLAFSSQAIAGVEVVDAWMRAMPPGQPTAAAYMTLKNTSPGTLGITAVSSPQARAVEIHESRQVDGSWRMRRLPRLELLAGATLHLEPGGIHLMLFGLRQSPQAGEQFEFTLTLADGETVSVMASVLAAGSTGHHQH
ncbi:MAG: copper chaperone PCu(A)C [Halieaceae bacterium]